MMKIRAVLAMLAVRGIVVHAAVMRLEAEKVAFFTPVVKLNLLPASCRLPDMLDRRGIEALLDHFTLEMLCKDLSANPCGQIGVGELLFAGDYLKR